MRFDLGRRAMLGSILLTICCSPSGARAQSSVPTYGGAKFLVIQREFTKPGRDGTAHQATEAAYLRAAEAGKAPYHYTALTSISGVNRALFLQGYPSLEALEQERHSVSESTQGSLDHAMMADGDLLSQQDASVWRVEPELSQNTDGPRVGSRYMIVRQYVIKPGHTEEWEKAVKIVKDGYEKANVGAHWSMYRLMFGSTAGPTYLILTSVKSMTEVDQMTSDDPKFAEAVGEQDLKRLDGLIASSVETEMSNMFAIDPKMSRPTEDMRKAEPDFWTRPKSAAARKSTAKPAASSGQ